MAVLVEGISVIIIMESVVERYPGGWEAFETDPPNATLCADGELIRLGFISVSTIPPKKCNSPFYGENR